MQTPEKNNYEFHEDAGHGWLRVPFVELIELGVQPTEYSYTDGEYAYLEEDEDAGRFLRALDPQWFAGPKDVSIWEKWHIATVNDGNSSFVRGLNRIGTIRKPTHPKAKTSRTYFPEIFSKWGIETESPAERKAKGSLRERYTNACRVIKKLKGWRTDSWYLMPVLWLEAKADELREKADAERAARAAVEAEVIVTAKAA